MQLNYSKKEISLKSRMGIFCNKLGHVVIFEYKEYNISVVISIKNLKCYRYITVYFIDCYYNLRCQAWGSATSFYLPPKDVNLSNKILALYSYFNKKNQKRCYFYMFCL